MKNTILTLLLLTTMGLLHAQDNYKVMLTSMVIQGTSNIHKWESKVGQLNGNAIITTNGGQITNITDARIDIPVKSIKSPKGSIMDNKTYSALKSDECPNISLKLNKASIENATLKMNVTLTIACTGKSIDLISTLNTTGGDQFVASGTKALKMTDFGIKPPTALLGTMTTGDGITIVYEVKLIKS